MHRNFGDHLMPQFHRVDACGPDVVAGKSLVAERCLPARQARPQERVSVSVTVPFKEKALKLESPRSTPIWQLFLSVGRGKAAKESGDLRSSSLARDDFRRLNCESGAKCPTSISTGILMMSRSAGGEGSKPAMRTRLSACLPFNPVASPMGDTDNVVRRFRNQEQRSTADLSRLVRSTDAPVKGRRNCLPPPRVKKSS